MITSSPDLQGRPERILPEFAFIGRSNCGKSSLINHILNRVAMARISRKPGKTRLLNYYLVDDSFYLVDLPGYGYAKVSKREREKWRKLFRAFLACQDRPLAVMQLLDARHDPSILDCEVSGWVQQSGHPFGIAVTKTDKVGVSQRARSYQSIIAALGVAADTPFFPTSSVKGQGRGEILSWIQAILEANTPEADI